MQMLELQRVITHFPVYDFMKEPIGDFDEYTTLFLRFIGEAIGSLTNVIVREIPRKGCFVLFFLL